MADGRDWAIFKGIMDETNKLLGTGKPYAVEPMIQANHDRTAHFLAMQYPLTSVAALKNLFATNPYVFLETGILSLGEKRSIRSIALSLTSSLSAMKTSLLTWWKKDIRITS